MAWQETLHMVPWMMQQTVPLVAMLMMQLATRPMVLREA
jgi:hypothetical protein|tara:strand:- start:387 stop:503 length:117 start_codon:yes stop_codon:yes gene_type:complete